MTPYQIQSCEILAEQYANQFASNPEEYGHVDKVEAYNYMYEEQRKRFDSIDLWEGIWGMQITKRHEDGPINNFLK